MTRLERTEMELQMTTRAFQSVVQERDELKAALELLGKVLSPYIIPKDKDDE